MPNRIRPATVLDILALSRSTHAALQLDVVQTRLYPHHPGWALLPWAHPPVYTLLARDASGLRASVQARIGGDNRTWDVAHLAAWQADAEQDWPGLLAALGAAAGQQGVLRLLAALPDERYQELFRRAGFTPFAQETILAHEHGAPPSLTSRTGNGSANGTSQQPVGPAPARALVRLRKPKDLGSVQRLYTALTPPLVQQAEGSRFLTDQPDEEAWLWPGENGLCACLQRRRSPHGCCLGLLLDPACRHHAPDLLAYGLAGAPPPIYLVLRSYQGELLEVARRLGFRPAAEQILLVKQLAVPEPLRQSVPTRSADRALGAAPSAPSVGRACAKTEN